MKSAKELHSEAKKLALKKEADAAAGVPIADPQKVALISNLAAGVGEANEKADLLQIVIFTLGKKEFCVDIHDTREIVKTQEITPIPNTPDFIKGMINLRGKIIVVVDLDTVFQIKREQESGKHIIIAEALDNAIGVMVDGVTEIIRVPRTSVKQAPEVVTKKIADHYLKGVIVIEDKLLIFLDLPNILSETELVELSTLAKAYQKPVKKKAEPEITNKEVKEKFERAEH